ncbi:hypothetical protein ACH4UT_10410 [Streptomyces sp. NPDC020799]|uniref:hypothetical protein n=1 Tax=Streptomyces sp. NPDC020799 TaxID=3365091 RepID=UPI0037B23AC0
MSSSRFGIHTGPEDPPVIFDTYRNRPVRHLPASTTPAQADAALRAIAAERTWATVIYREAHTGPRGDRWENTFVTGDIMSCGPRERVVFALSGHWVTIPAAQHIRTIYGSAVPGYRQGGSGPWASVGEPTGRVDFAGWTAPRHHKLRKLTLFQAVPAWFAEFARRYALGSRSLAYDQVLRNSYGTDHALIPNGTAHRLLGRWDLEHPTSAAAA